MQDKNEIKRNLEKILENIDNLWRHLWSWKIRKRNRKPRRANTWC